MSGRYAAFGARWEADLALPHFDRADRDDAGDDPIAVRTVAALPRRAPLREVNGGFVYADGFRVAWRDEATFDCHDGTRIDCLPGTGWTGVMPAAFYSTVAALTLAWRGALPCHASTVEVAGKAIMIAGVGGAGKSTLTATLLERGGRLIADDLSVIRRMAGGGFTVNRGRPDIRLHAATAARLPATARCPIPGDDRGKWLVRPRARSPHEALPLAGILLLGSPAQEITPNESAILLGPHLFRPRWLAALPDHAGRLRTMLAIAAGVPCRGLDPGAGFHRDPSALARAERAIAALIADDRSL